MGSYTIDHRLYHRYSLFLYHPNISPSTEIINNKLTVTLRILIAQWYEPCCHSPTLCQVATWRESPHLGKLMWKHSEETSQHPSILSCRSTSGGWLTQLKLPSPIKIKGSEVLSSVLLTDHSRLLKDGIMVYSCCLNY